MGHNLADKMKKLGIRPREKYTCDLGFSPELRIFVPFEFRPRIPKDLLPIGHIVQVLGMGKPRDTLPTSGILAVYQAAFEKIQILWLARTSEIPETAYFNVATVPEMCDLEYAKFPFSWKNFKNAASWVDPRKEFYRGKRGAATPHGGQTSNLPPSR